MKKIMLNTLTSLLSLGAFGYAGSYTEVHSWATIVNGNGSGSHFAAISDGANTYHLLTLNSKPAITKVDAFGNATTLVSPSQWQTASGLTGITSFYNLGLEGDNLLFAESSSDNVWSVNINSGAITTWATKSAISSYLNIDMSSVALLANATSYNGDYYFYEGNSDSILKVNSSGILSNYLTQAQLDELSDAGSLSGGLAFDSQGNIIWGDATNDSLYSWNNISQVSEQVLSASQIAAVTGSSKAAFGDILQGIDGLVYFYETVSDNILSYDPSAPASTLNIVLSEADLLAGPAASDSVYSLAWYNDNLAFNVNGTKGFYVVPEPATVIILAGGSMLSLARRKRA